MTTWILVANSSVAKLYKCSNPLNLQNDHDINPILDLVNHEGHELNQDLSSDKSGNMKSNGGSGSYSQKTSPKQHANENFAKRVAEHLNQCSTGDHFDHIILVAAPAFLGLLRPLLNDHVNEKISHTVNKDLCNIDDNALVQHLNIELE